MLISLKRLLMKKTGMQVCFCCITLWGSLLVNTTWAQCSFQIQTTGLCKYIPELNKKAAKHTGTDACVHMGLKMCTNCGQIHRPKKHQSIPKHARVRKHTERCDVPGRAVKSCYLRKHLAKQTKASQGKCLFHCPEQHSQHLRGEGAENGRGAIRWIHTRYDEREHDREIMEAWGWGGRTNWRVGGEGEQKAAGRKLNRKQGQKV